MKSNNKLTIVLILVLSLVLFSTSAYAKSFTDVLGDSFALINDFFKNEGYKPYSLIIDFFVFSIVFMAIYMRGVKFAFKEVTKTEKALAVILGLTTAFLMVIGGYSISKLLPFVNWFLYFLLFVLIWWLLKDMKSKWSRFFLALLLTLLLILIFLALFSGISANISCPESALPWLPWVLALLLFILFLFLLKDIKNAFGRFLLALLLTITVVLLILFLLNTFSKDLGCPEGPFTTSLIGDIGDSFKRMDIGSAFGGFGTGPSLPTLTQVAPPTAPGSPGALGTSPQLERPFKQTDNQELNRLLRDPQTPTNVKPKIEEEIKIRGLQLATPATPKKPEEKKKEGGWSWGWIIGLPLALAVGAGGFFGGRKGLFGKRVKSILGGEGGFIGDAKAYVIGRIIKTIQELEEISAKIIDAQDKKDKFVLLGENKEKLLEALEKASLANLWTEEGRKLIKEEHPILDELLVLEEMLRHQLRHLRTAENLFLSNLDSWQQFIPPNFDKSLRNLASRSAKPSEFKQMGVMQLISVCDAFEKQDGASIEELLTLMKEGRIGELVKGKYEVVRADWDRLKKYNTHENTILALIIRKVKIQNYLLKRLQRTSEAKTDETDKGKVTEKTGKTREIPREIEHTPKELVGVR